MAETKQEETLLNPRIRIFAEAAYLVNPSVLARSNQSQNDPKSIYQELIAHEESFKQLKTCGYEFLDLYDHSQDGFYGVALKSNNQKILVSIRGTDFENLNLSQLILDGFLGWRALAVNCLGKFLSSDLYSDSQIALGRVPTQYKSAIFFIENLLLKYPGYEFSITGHSLGGLLAQLIAAKFNFEAIVFDSPGAKKFIDVLVGPTFNQKIITIINELPNFINTSGEHIKVPIAINNGGMLVLGSIKSFLKTFPRDPSKPSYLISHGMGTILNSINQDGSCETIPIKTWPKNSFAFYRTQAAYQAMPEIYDEYLYELWEKRGSKLAFDDYRAKFLKQLV